MATVEQKVCDVYGTTQSIKTYAVHLYELDSGREDNIVEIKADLSPRGLQRAERLIRKAFSSAKRTAGGAK